MTSCAPIAADVEIDPAVLATQTVIAGIATKNGQPVSTGYARLLDSSGEFVAEVPLTQKGGYRFFARPGEWTVKLLTSGDQAQLKVTAVQGANLDNHFQL
ncbi:MAG: hypothetical protein RIS43_223 [Actinomycetota bacterium]|jgi:hypothetical protein